MTTNKQPFIALFLLFSFCFMSCSRNQAPMSLHWEMGANDIRPGVCEMYLTITNTSSKLLTNEGWTLYFDYMSVHPLTMTAGEHDLIAEEHTRLIAGSIPNSTLLILAGEDHGSHIWQNPKMGNILIDFFREKLANP